MNKIYKMHGSITKDIIGIGCVPLVVFYVFYCFVVPILEMFRVNFTHGVQRFINNFKDVFSYDFLTGELWKLLFMGWFVIYISVYPSFRNFTQQAKLLDHNFEIILIKNEIINSMYSDVLEISYNDMEMYIKTRDRKKIYATNDLTDFAEFCDLLIEKVKAHGAVIKKLESRR